MDTFVKSIRLIGGDEARGGAWATEVLVALRGAAVAEVRIAGLDVNDDALAALHSQSGPWYSTRCEWKY